MVNKISIKNYKAFKDASIELKPITIFLGANSVGKSSIMKLLLLIAQNTNSTNTTKTPLKINGDTIQLGSFENIIHKKNLSSKLNISFHIDKLNMIKYRTKIKNNILDIYESLKKTYLLYYEGVDDFDSITRDLRKEIINEKKKKNNTLEQIFLDMSSYQRKINLRLKKDDENSMIFRIASLFLQDYNEFSKKHGIHFDILSYKNLFNYLIKLDEENFKSFEIKYTFSFSKENIKIIKFEIYSDSDINIFSYEHKGAVHKITSHYLNDKTTSNLRTKFGKAISFNQFQVQRVNKQSENNIFVNTLIDIVDDFVDKIKHNFNYSNINYVDPLRAYPRRYYFLDEKDIFTSLNKIDGEKMATMLKENTALRKKVNKWIGKFNLKVNIEQLQDTIHNIKISQNGLSLDITDVGFGISQVLPIITQGFFSTKNSTTLIEQPEIHLHPKMQAELSDLFIDIIQEEKESNKRIIIETHSEYLLKRLRRRIAEGAISNKDIAIYSFSLDSETNNGTISKLDIDNKGAFEWPKDFYDTDMEDTINFLKYQDN